MGRAFGNFDAVRWTATEGAKFIDLGPDPLLLEADTSRAWDISADGSVILGTAEIDRVFFPFVLTAGDVAVRIEPILVDPIVINLSADGTVVAGGLFEDGGSCQVRCSYNEKMLSQAVGMR